jgi:hypothetical protein
LRFAFVGMRPVWSRFLAAGSLFRPALFLSVEGWNPHNHCNHRPHHARQNTPPRRTGGSQSFRTSPADSRHPGDGHGGIGYAPKPAIDSHEAYACPGTTIDVPFHTL